MYEQWKIEKEASKYSNSKWNYFSAEHAGKECEGKKWRPIEREKVVRSTSNLWYFPLKK